MKARILLIIILSGLLFLFPAPLHATPTGQGQQLFFDDFSTSQLSPKWSPYSQIVYDNISQAGGWLSMIVQRNTVTTCSCVPNDNIWANQGQPIVSGVSGQFVYMVVRTVPFNLTQVGNNPGTSTVSRDAGMSFGLESAVSGGGTTYGTVGVVVTEGDKASDTVLNSDGVQRESAMLTIQSLQTARTLNCFSPRTGNAPIGQLVASNCTNFFKSIIYTSPSNPIDMNTAHLFTLEMNLQNDNSSWIGMKIDDNAWINMTQIACNCIESSAKQYLPLFPYLSNGYCMANCSGSPPSPNQSLGTLVNYVLIDNYVPLTLPVGSPAPIITVNPINNPSATPLNPFNGISPSNLWQSFAVEIGKGVPTGTDQFLISPYYFGGAVLYAITVVMLLLATIFTPLDSMKNPFIVSLLLFFDTIANFVLGTLSVWIFAGVVVFFMAVMVGTVPATIGGKAQG